MLVCYDLLGLTPDLRPRFVKRYAEFFEDGVRAASAFREEVRSGAFPTEAHGFGDVKREARRTETEMARRDERPADLADRNQPRGYGPAE